MVSQDTEAKVLSDNGNIYPVLLQSLSFPAQSQGNAVLSEVVAFTLVIYGKASPS